ncbi:MAG: hypothetical protein IJZ79_02815 [Bacilli bacterium]|nr:hypothetical protein [Bacilli bacterium]MBQ8218657.1 hypothetical protein [Bacilli bacterium]
MEFLEYLISLPSLGVALLLTIANIVRIVLVHNKNNRTISAEEYVNENDYNIISKNAKFVRSYETKVKLSDNKK